MRRLFAPELGFLVLLMLCQLANAFRAADYLSRTATGPTCIRPIRAESSMRAGDEGTVREVYLPRFPK